MKNQISAGGRYLILEEIGKGGYSKVYKVRDIRTGAIFAMKQYKTSDSANEEILLDSIGRELNVLKHTSHPGLPTIYNLIKEEQKFFLIMEYVEGINLKEFIHTQGIMDQKQLVLTVNQICSALYYLHSLNEPIVYRDLKPSNIILQRNGKIKLIDFGVAKRYNTEISADNYAYGSKGFAAPEQYGDNFGRGIYNTDIRTDIYGVGATMYYLATGNCTFNNKINDFYITGRLKKVIRKCTNKNPNKRFQNCIELLCDLQNCKTSFFTTWIAWMVRKFKLHMNKKSLKLAKK